MPEQRGISLPFRVTPGDADIATASGANLREARVSTIFGMRASSGDEVGELSWDPQRGSRLDALRNAAASPAVADFAALYCEEALLAALPSERLRSISVALDDRTIELSTETVLTTDARGTSRLPVTTTITR